MPGVLLRDHYPCTFDGEEYYIAEIDAARVQLPDASLLAQEGVSIRIIPHAKLNNLQYGDTTLLLTFNDARLLAQAILSVAFEGVDPTFGHHWGGVQPESTTTFSRDKFNPASLSYALQAFAQDPEPPDLLGAEPEVGRLPADPRTPAVPEAPDDPQDGVYAQDDPDLPADWGKV